MAYVLDAVIAEDDVATRVAFTLRRPAVRLHENLALVPLTPSTGGVAIDEIQIVRTLERATNWGPAARVSAELWGGTGGQSATVYVDGRAIWTRRLEIGATPPRDEGRTPISEALSLLGVEASVGTDEFGVVGLGRHRMTGEWRTEPTISAHHDEPG